MAQITPERVQQLVRAGLPFDPFYGAEIGGQSLTRLRDGMRALKWTDLRFISRDDAQRLGWEIEPEAKSVQVRYSDGRTDALFNVDDVRGVPSIADMLEFTEQQLSELQSVGVVQDMDNEVRIIPAARSLDKEAVERDPIPPGSTKAPSGRYVVAAPYWLDGLHNYAGLRAAKELNEVMRSSGISRNPKAMERLLSGRDSVSLYELRIITEEEHERDTEFWRNPAEPESLLDGVLVRDKEGAYRPSAGGRVVIVDEGESLVIKSKGSPAYEAAIELAKAKGWTAIELSGKGKMLSNAWLEAKVAGIDVVNYKPTLDDEKRLAERLALEAEKVPAQEVQQNVDADLSKAGKEKTEAPTVAPEVDQEEPAGPAAALDEAAPSAPLQVGSEQVEIHPYVDAEGHQKTATVVYTVTQEGQPNQEFDDAGKAAKAFVDAPGKNKPAVVRAILRADGEPGQEVIASVERVGRNKLAKRADSLLDPEFHDAFTDLVEKEKHEPTKEKDGFFTGRVLAIEGDELVQKVGRSPTEVKRHPIALLSRLPAVGEVVDIHYGDRAIQVSDKQVELSR